MAEEGLYVPIGGIRQWIQIRGEDRANPVLLYVHGGPGASALALSWAWQPWEKYFTVVQWDQRGAGRTYRLNGDAEAPGMTIDQMTKDGIEVAEYLRAHLHKEKIVLLGHSWGSILGINMVRRRPDLFSAYVGTGQFVEAERNEAYNYAHVLAQETQKRWRSAFMQAVCSFPDAGSTQSAPEQALKHSAVIVERTTSP